MTTPAPNAEAPESGATFTIVRARDSHTHTGRKQRAEADADFELHPAIARGMALIRETAYAGGASVQTLFSSPTIHVSLAWFKSGFPLPLHSHDVDCFYLVVGGSMRVGTEELLKGDGVSIPSGVPYTVTPGDAGVEFLEIRNSPDFDTHYRAKTDAYWDKVIATRRERAPIWANEPPPYGLLTPAQPTD